MFKVHNKLSIVNFEHVIAGWVRYSEDKIPTTFAEQIWEKKVPFSLQWNEFLNIFWEIINLLEAVNKTIF